MSFSPIPELLEEIRAGRMVVIVDDEDRENEGDLIMAAELVRPQDVNFMVTHARGLVCLSLTRERCRQLGLPPMVRDNTSPHHTNFTVSIEAAEGVTTGISAYDRAHTVRTAVRPDAAPHDLSQPGHIFPLMAQPGGVLSRAGHTEAASDLALLAGLEPAGVLVEILNPDGSMARCPELEVFAAEHGLKMGSIEELIRYRLENEHTVERVETRAIETEHGPFTLAVYRDRVSHALHFALLRGEADPAAPTLVRVHMLNPLADALHWRRTDFGPAVGDVLAQIAADGRGALVLLSEPFDDQSLLARIREQPAPDPQGRGAGLAEWRRNGAGAQILADLGLGRLRVIGTPRKQIGLAGFGLEVVEYVEPRRAGKLRSPLRIPPMPHIEGDLRSPTGARYAIIASRWNPRITDALVAGARKTFADHGVAEDSVDVVRVPGAWEIPVAIARLAPARRHVAFVALGCVIRGDTRHYEQVADGCSDALMRLQVEHGLPVANGVLAVDRFEDAQARADGSHGNKGEEAALVAIEMAHLLAQLPGDNA